MHSVQRAGADRNVIAEQEIEEAQVETVYDAVTKLRPEYLRHRGRTSILMDASDEPVVFVEHTFYGPLASLKQMLARDVSRVRFYPGADAVTLFGRAYAGGVVQLTPRSH